MATHHSIEAQSLAAYVESSAHALREVAARLGEISGDDFSHEQNALLGIVNAVADSLEFRTAPILGRGVQARDIPNGHGEGRS